MAKDINKSPFSEETQTKLDIFAECFKEWFPVATNHAQFREVHIYDFFAGSGYDEERAPGSPLRLLQEARGKDNCYCKRVREKHKKVVFYFNEKKSDKLCDLKNAVVSSLSDCEKNCSESCIYSEIQYSHLEFQEAFEKQSFRSVLANPRFAKFILLDQYGFKHVDGETFLDLITAPATDFIFFISSSYIRRFRNHPAVKRYFDIEKIEFEVDKPQNCHRQIAAYYRHLIPLDREYYLHHFTIKKGGNYWGLIFGSKHTWGMEKFLKVCWLHDKYAGESNFNIDNNWDDGSLFAQFGQSIKKDRVKKQLREDILGGKIGTNLMGMKAAMLNGCMPKLFIEVVKELKKEGVITVAGTNGMNPSYAATDIHNVTEFAIKLNLTEAP